MSSAEHVALRAFDADLFLLGHGLRDLARKEDVSARRRNELGAWAASRGLHLRAVATGGPDAAARGLGASGESSSVFIGRDEASLDAAIGWTRIEEAAGHVERERAVRELGRLLGYPACCVDAFAAQPTGDDAASLGRLFGSTPLGTIDPLCNFLLPGSPVRHVPCAWDCGATHQAAREALRRAAQVAPAVAASLRALMSCALLVYDRFRVVVLVGQPRADGTIAVSERYTLLDLCSDEALHASPELRRFARSASELPSEVPPTGLPGARLLRFSGTEP